MRTINLLLIVFCLSFTASSQDSLNCFTIEQTKVFLRTKVELNNCLEQFDVISSDLSASKERNVVLTSDNAKLRKKVKVNRKWGIISTSAGVGIIALWIFIK